MHPSAFPDGEAVPAEAAADGAGVCGGVRVGVKTKRNVGDAVGVRLGVYVGNGVQVEVGEGVVNSAVLV